MHRARKRTKTYCRMSRTMTQPCVLLCAELPTLFDRSASCAFLPPFAVQQKEDAPRRRSGKVKTYDHTCGEAKNHNLQKHFAMAGYSPIPRPLFEKSGAKTLCCCLFRAFHPPRRSSVTICMIPSCPLAKYSFKNVGNAFISPS